MINVGYDFSLSPPSSPYVAISISNNAGTAGGSASGTSLLIENTIISLQQTTQATGLMGAYSSSVIGITDSDLGPNTPISTLAVQNVSVNVLINIGSNDLVQIQNSAITVVVLAANPQHGTISVSSNWNHFRPPSRRSIYSLLTMQALSVKMMR
jgi:hypothetical protein